MKIKQFVFNLYQENTYLLYDETNAAVIVDAGCSSKEEYEELLCFLQEHELTLTHSIYTHLHFDHVLGANFLKSYFGLQPEANRGDEFFYKDTRQLVLDNLNIQLEAEVPPIAHYLDEGTFTFGNSELQIIFVPGHSPGSLVFYSEKDQFALVGDVIFKGSVGRTDLWGGNFEQLIHGIKTKLLTLPGATKLYSGHGEYTTVEYEQRHNSFLI